MCQLSDVAPSSFLGTQEATATTPSRNIDNSRLTMADAFPKKATLENSSLPAIEISTSARGKASAGPLNAGDGRPVSHRIDTKGSVQALVVNKGIIIAGLQDGTLAVSDPGSLVLRKH